MSERVFTLAELAAHLGAELSGPGDRLIGGVASLVAAGPRDISFFSNRLYREQLAHTQAGAVLTHPAYREDCPTAALLLGNPYLGYAKVAALFAPAYPPPAGIHPSAWVSPEARVDPGASIGPQAVVEASAEIGPGVIVGAAGVVGRACRLGAGCYLHPRVTLYPGVILGERVIIHSGAVIGADGFGLANDQGIWIKVPQLGGVRIGDDVEIGANTTVDRGALEDTVLEEGVKLDNLIQIAHNVRVGAHTAIAACVGIAGSTRVGRHCSIGGGVGIVGHIEIVDHVHITGGSVVLQSISEPGVYSSGSPLQANRKWHRNFARMKQLEDLARRLQCLEEKVK